MAVSRNRRSTDAARVTGANALARGRRTLRRFLARPVIGIFIVVPLLGAFLGMGSPSWLVTLSGAAALYLAVDLFLEWLRRPVRGEAAAHLNLLAWTAGIGVLAAASWTSPAWQYHGELAMLAGMVVAFAVGLGSPRVVAVLWVVAAGAAVALGASLAGPLTAESGIAAASMAVATWFGAVVGEIIDRRVGARHTPARAASRAASRPVTRTANRASPARARSRGTPPT